ncbi:NUDIX hydrolase N-terminal domain-containing protein [Gemella sp. zg-570]|uniref:NUDIX hydrolase n=1 Tax=Gemella sp. zg-570 TaxID=2840371 RepID=UPI001C0E49E8|nr:NUDIX hydrolase N-terminal domain-containing protein [Gemella sp. zg-570]QWQ38157.1 NUDIX hydrolase N-terminal domain-containing protein [Gemella sp. zg-570]
MFKKLLIDIELKDIIDNNIKNLYLENNINFDYIDRIDSPIKNTLYLTANKDKITSNCQSVFLILNDYEFLDIKNSICIKFLEDVIKIYKSDLLVSWATELQFLAQNTLAYSKNQFDIERAERIREIACEMISYKYKLPIKKVKNFFANEVGYQTPKIENRAVIIKDYKILLVKEKIDGKWALPGGYQDVNKTLRENIIKESYEEAGAVVNPIKVIALLNYNKHHEYSFPLGMMKIFVLCDYLSHNFLENTETESVGFFSLNELPELSQNRTTKEQIEMCFECYKNVDEWEVIFD